MNQPLLAQTIISSMITPAFLIIGSANLANIALQRLARIVDRMRRITESQEVDQKPLFEVALLKQWLGRYEQRVSLASHAVLAFFTGVGMFVMACLSIALDHYWGGDITWLPVSLTIIGMLIMLGGAALLAQEARLAHHQISEEIKLKLRAM